MDKTKTLLTNKQRGRLETDLGRSALSSMSNPSKFYYDIRQKGKAAFETLVFLATHLPERQQKLLFTHENITKLLDAVIYTSAQREKGGERYVNLYGTPGTRPGKPGDLKLDGAGLKMWKGRNERVTRIMYEAMSKVDQYAQNIESVKHATTALRTMGLQPSGIQALKLAMALRE